MMISNLPSDLVEDILSRLPLTSMRAVRLTCKSWNSLSKSEIFTTMHIAKEEEAAMELGESRMIALMDYNLYLMSPVVDVNEKPSTEPKAKLAFLNKQVKISEVFYCEGILLCILEDDTSKIVVWNPYWGQTRWIKTREFDLKRYVFRYAIGYDNNKKKSCRNKKIKILRSIDNNMSLTGYEFSQYEIYDFESGLWRTLDFSPQWLIRYGQCGVGVKGNTYWCATQRRSYGLICFDFTRERFGPLVSLPFLAEDGDIVTLSCVREEKLAVLFQSMDTFVTEIWITTKIDEAQKVSWSKLLTIDTLTVNEGSFFIDEEKKVAMVFGNIKKHCRLDTVKIFGEDGYIRELKLGEPLDKLCFPCVCSYLVSLVEIKQP